MPGGVGGAGQHADRPYPDWFFYLGVYRFQQPGGIYRLPTHLCASPHNDQVLDVRTLSLIAVHHMTQNAGADKKIHPQMYGWLAEGVC